MYTRAELEAMSEQHLRDIRKSYGFPAPGRPTKAMLVKAVLSLQPNPDDSKVEMDQEIR